jgi:peptidoglycan/LPS O-acetylase OafA/YrhL
VLFSIFVPDAVPSSDANRSSTETFILSALFLDQSWALEIYPFAVGPYWSLCYEVAYYLIFGLFVFSTGWIRLPFVIAGCAIAGPKILILLPCWLFGVAAYKLRERALGKYGDLATAIGAPLLLVVAFHFGLKNIANDLSESVSAFRYRPSDGFVRDWLVAGTFAIHLWAMCRISVVFPPILKSTSRKLADMSFSLYLPHLPLLYLLAYALGHAASIWFVVLTIPTVFAASFLFAGARKQGDMNSADTSKRYFLVGAR